MWVNGRKRISFEPLQHKSIWMHCASLGEFEQGRPVLEALKSAYPDYPVVLSFFSPSGYEIRKDYPLADIVTYLPLDTPGKAEEFMSAVNPALVARLWMTYMRYLVVPGPINARWSSDDNHVVKLNEKTQSSSGLFGNGIQI